MHRSTVHGVAFAVVAACVVPLPVAAGLVFEQVTRGEGEAASAMNMTSRVWASGDGTKIEILAAGDNPMFKEGSYMLMRPKDTAMIIVNPQDETYMRFDVGQMAAMAGQMAQRQDQAMEQAGHGSMKPRVTNAKTETLVDEAGPAMLGFPTHHQKFHITYTMTTTMGGMEMAMDTDSIEEVWSTEAIGDVPTAKLLGDGGGMSNSELSKVGKGADIKGIPLKRIVTTTTKMGGKGFGMGMMSKMANKGMKPSRMFMEITKIEQRDIPASTFRVPAGYAEIDMFGGGKMPDLNDPGN